jgi:hypothetical protein
MSALGGLNKTRVVMVASAGSRRHALCDVPGELSITK